MRLFLFNRYSGPFVALGGLVAAACLASIWYINRLQSDLARAVRHDAARMEAAEELQVQLRHLRYHTLIYVADPTDTRRSEFQADATRINVALATIRQTSVSPDDIQLADEIQLTFAKYLDDLELDHLPPPTWSMAQLARWSDAHRLTQLLDECRELAQRQRDRMTDGVEQSEDQTVWAGRVLFALGLTGALGGLLCGYATARGLTRRAAQLSVRVRAVQAQLNQDVGAMTVEGPRPLGDLDEQLDHVVGRVKEVCQRLQEQERDLLRAEQLAAVGHLAAGVAHEVRNPLTGIKFLVEAALRPSRPTPLTPEDLQLIRQEIVRIERTIQELLDYARTPLPDRRPHDVRDLVAESAGVARGRAEAKSITLQVVSPAEPVRVLVDDDQLRSLLTNLLFNAIDASPTGGKVEVCVKADPGKMVVVNVADTGPGIDPAVASRLFTPFATTKPTGTGLGLTIARRIARDHNGSLTAANRAEGGACFTLTLPGEQAADVP